MIVPPHDRPETNAALLRECRATFDWWVRWSSSTAGVGLLFVWAVAEATVWPILPDFLLVPIVLGNRRRFYIPLAAAIAGMAIGGTFLYLFAFWHPQQAVHLLHHLPTVREAAINRAHSYLADHGLAALIFQPWSGVPFKVWALLAGSEARNPAVAIPLFILARSARMAILAALASLFAQRFTRFLRDYSLFLLVIYLALFFYGWWQLIR